MFATAPQTQVNRQYLVDQEEARLSIGRWSATFHGREESACTFAHFFGRQVFLVGRDAPMVTVRIGHFAEAVTPEHVVDRRNNLAASRDGLVINHISI